MMARSRWRSSTTSSAPARARRAARWPALAASSLMDQLARTHRHAIGPAALPPQARSRSASSSSNSPSTRRERRRLGADARRPRLPQGRAASQQGGDALVARATSTSWSIASRTASPIPTTSSTARASARSACEVTTPPRPSTRARGAAGPALPASRRARRAGHSRRARASAAAWSTSRPKSELGTGLGDRVRAAAREPAAMPAPADRGRSHLAVDAATRKCCRWLLFYTALLDVRKTPPQPNVADPARAGAEPGGRVPPTARCASCSMPRRAHAHAVRPGSCHEFFGSGVQHIAFATADIFATVARLAANGVRLLPIPGNYYDDLEAGRSAPERIDDLRAHNILYDRDGDGEYLPDLYRRPSRSGSSSRSSSGAAIAVMAPPTRRSGWRRRPAEPGPRCAGGRATLTDATSRRAGSRRAARRSC